MSASMPVYAPCSGGLVLNVDKFSLLDRPGVAIKLRNYEVAIRGGYRRINGYAKFGSTSATQPSGAADNILGVYPYALGLVVCVSDDVYYSEDGISWLQINKDTGGSGLTEANMPAAATLARASQDRAEFVLARGTTGHATNPYGVLYIATRNNKIAKF